MNFKTSNTRRKGFTILELMVAMTITAIIVGVLVSITGTAIDTWNRSRNELRAARQAEAMIKIMSKDLESLVVRSDRQQEWLSARLMPPTEGGSTNAARLIFFTAATDRYEGQVGVTGVDEGGDISCVAYQLDWKDPVAAGAQQFETFVLNRHIVDPDDTFENLLGQTDDVNTLDVVFNNNYGTQIDQDRNFVCENIFQFTMVFHIDVVDATGNLQTELVSVSPSTAGKTALQVKHNIIQTTPEQIDLSFGVLTAVEVSITVLSDPAIAQLRANQALAEDSDWLSANSYNFTRLVQVPRK
ncbi:MAG: prepilin-type N-terminal cleavage/methylation domain-containing protein [Phycisphaeraceae bacterium]|nr:prepilin-type N-terminal cleavage/methylation domain-containing protein [Phycisphaeraceae bacterium]